MTEIDPTPAVLTFNLLPQKDCTGVRRVSHTVIRGQYIPFQVQPQAPFRPEGLWVWGHGQVTINSLVISSIEQIVQPLSSETLMSPEFGWFETILVKSWETTKYPEFPLTRIAHELPISPIRVDFVTVTPATRVTLVVSGTFIGAAMIGTAILGGTD